MMKTLNITALLLLSFSLFCSFSHAQDWAGEKEWAEQIALRYDPAGWPAKNGPVVAGLEMGKELTEGFGLSSDYNLWIDVDDERIVQRYFTAPEGRTTVGIAAARSCAAAHKVLFKHLARPRAMVPLEPPALPYGEIRLEGVGDICFATPIAGGGGFHSIAFTRFNVAVLLRTFDREAAGTLRDLAVAFDKAIVGQRLYKDWISSNQWPEIVRFDAAATRVKTKSIVPLAVDLSTPASIGTPLVIDWEMSAGGIATIEDASNYHAEGEGVESLTLLVADQRGLTTSSKIEFEITR